MRSMASELGLRVLRVYAFITSLLLRVVKIDYLVLLHRLKCSCVLLLWSPIKLVFLNITKVSKIITVGQSKHAVL